MEEQTVQLSGRYRTLKLHVKFLKSLRLNRCVFATEAGAVAVLVNVKLNDVGRQSKT